MTKRQQKFVTALTNPEVDTIAEAARIAGYGSPRQRGQQALQSVTVQAALKDYIALLDNFGATNNVTALRLAEGLHAEKVSMFGKKCGPDFEQRGKYVDRINKIRGYMRGEDDGEEAGKLVIVIGDKGLDEII